MGILFKAGDGSHKNLRASDNFISLDVEGAEAEVLETVDPGLFDVVLVEMEEAHTMRMPVDEVANQTIQRPHVWRSAKDARVHDLLTAGGLRHFRELRLGMPANGGVNRIYLRNTSELGRRWSQSSTARSHSRL